MNVNVEGETGEVKENLFTSFVNDIADALSIAILLECEWKNKGCIAICLTR